MAYAATTILLETLEQFSVPNKHLVLANNDSLQSLTGTLKFFQEFLQRITDNWNDNSSIKIIELRIRDVVYKAQDLVEEVVSSNAGYSGEAIDIFDQEYDIHHTLKEINSIMTVAKQAHTLILNGLSNFKVISSLDHKLLLIAQNKAYAASTILLETLERFSIPNEHLVLANNNSLQSLTGTLKFFQEFLQCITDIWNDNNSSIERIEVRIRDVVYKAQDLVDEFVSTNAGNCGEAIDIFDQKYDIHHTLQRIVEEIDSIRTDAKQVHTIFSYHRGSRVVQASSMATRRIARSEIYASEEGIGIMGDWQEGSRVVQVSSMATGSRTLDFGKWDGIVVNWQEGFMMIVNRLLLSSRRLDIISILGGKQMGKTTLALNAYNHPRVVQEFDIRVYIKESWMLQRGDILRCILHSIEGKKFSDGKYGDNEKRIGKHLKQRLKFRKFLIVIEDIWGSRVFDNISRWFPHDQTGSRVILTSRFRDVAICPYTFSRRPNPVKHLPSIEDWESIRWKLSLKISCPPELYSIGIEIIEKCQGLQKLVHKVSELLCQTTNTPPDWQNVSKSICRTLKVVSSDGCFHMSECSLGLSKEFDSTRINQEKEQEDYVPGLEMVEDEVENVVVGLEDDVIKIKGQLMSESRGLEIVTVVGMGGIGKTTLAKAVFDDPLIKYHFYIRAWIRISQLYHLRDLLLGLLQKVVHLDGKVHKMNNDQLREKLYRCLKGQRFLIVMDDMWTTQTWDGMRRCFPDDRNGSRMLFTSRLKSLAEYVSPNPPHQMSFLNKHQSWKLLHQRIFSKQNCPPDLMDIGKRIAEKCQGLPLAILVLAGILSNMNKTCDIWENVAESMPQLLTSDLNQFLEILAMSYNYLPHHLKACFLYFCAFPGDCEIQYWRLIRLFIAEGFVTLKCCRSLEELAEEYMEDLIGRNLILVGKRSYNGNVKTCYIHDLLRDLALREAKKESFMHVITGQGQIPLEENRVHRRLSLHSGSSDNFYSKGLLQLAHSLLCFDIGFNINDDIDIFLSNFKFKLLRVLDIDFMLFNYFPHVLLKLINLRFIAITVTCNIPSAISELLNLQTMIIHGPWLRKEFGKSPHLPIDVWKMSNLRHLRLSAASFLPEPPRAEDDQNNCLVLQNLQTLSTIRPTNCTEEVLKNLPNLKKLGIQEIKEDFDNYKGLSCFPSNLFYLHHLETLRCSFYGQNQEKMRLPDWTAFPPGLKKLTLCASHLSWDDMDTLGMLPNLEILKLKNYAFQGEVWEPKEGGFLCLKLLLIDKTDLVHWEANKYSIPRLQYLILRSCQSLEEIPYDIADDLQLIELQNCSSSAERSAVEIQEEEKKKDNDGLVVHILPK